MQDVIKYYTPKIEDFYIGYEYEYTNTSLTGIIYDHSNNTYTADIGQMQVWKKGILKLPTSYMPDGALEYIDSLIELKQIRVKCLDKYDILELNFIKKTDYWIGYDDYYKQIEKANIGYYLYITFHFCKIDSICKIILHRYNPENRDIENDLKEKDSECVFIGSIKSINELNLILKLIYNNY